MNTLNLLIQALLLGGYYALIACGLSFMYSVMKVINLAHGSFAVLAAYLIWVLADVFHIHPVIGLVMALPIMAILGLAFQKFLLERTARSGELMPILTTFGLAIVIDNGLFQVFGADTRSLAPFLGDLAWDSWELPGGIYVAKVNVAVLASAVVLLGGLQLFLKRTMLGCSIRATASDADTAGVVGIDAQKASMVASAIALVNACIAGAALGVRTVFDAYSGAFQLLFAFEATIIGGVGSLWGTLIGGTVLAIAQTFGASLHPQGFLLGGHLVFLAVLIVRFYRSQGGLLQRLGKCMGVQK